MKPLTRPAKPHELREAIKIYRKDIGYTGEVHSGLKGVAIQKMNELFGSDDARRNVLGYLLTQSGLFSPISSKSLTSVDWTFIAMHWLCLGKVDDQWVVNDAVYEEANQIRQLLNIALPKNNGEKTDSNQEIKTTVI